MEVASVLGFCNHTELITALDGSAYATCMARCMGGCIFFSHGLLLSLVPLSGFVGHIPGGLYDQTLMFYLKGREQQQPHRPIVIVDF